MPIKARVGLIFLSTRKISAFCRGEKNLPHNYCINHTFCIGYHLYAALLVAEYVTVERRPD
jgi:hypothetical protein